MRLRTDPAAGTDGEIERLEKDLRAAPAPSGTSPPEHAYWQNLIVHTNARIDRVASGRGITISWVIRVAVPGVVALVSFLIALYYYVPDYPLLAPLPSVVSVLPSSTLDSLVTTAVTEGDESLLENGMARSLFAVEADAAAEYLLATAPASALVDSLGEREVTELLAVLGSYND